MKKKFLISLSLIFIILILGYGLSVYLQSVNINNEQALVVNIADKTGAEKEKLKILSSEKCNGYFFIYYIDESYNSYKYCLYAMKKTIMPSRYKMTSHFSDNTSLCEATCNTKKDDEKIYIYYGENNGELKRIILNDNNNEVLKKDIEKGTYMFLYQSKKDTDFHINSDYIFNSDEEKL